MRTKYFSSAFTVFFIVFLLLLVLVPTSIVSFCHTNQCGFCVAIGHHLDQIKNLFGFSLSVGAFLWFSYLFVATIFSIAPLLFIKKDYTLFKLYTKGKRFNAAHCLLFDPFARALSDGVIKQKVDRII